MRHRLASAIVLLLSLPSLAAAQSVVLPAEVRGEVREWVMVVPDKFKNGNTVVNWQIGPGLADETARFEKLFGTKAQGKILKANKAGRYEVRAWVNGDAQLPLDRVAVLNILSNKALSDSAKVLQAEALLQGVSVCTVVIVDPGPLPPEPKPPEPKPPEPKPPEPPPVKGLKVLIVYESGELSNLTADQTSVLYGKAVRDKLNTLTDVGADGKTREWRIWDKDVDAGKVAPHWGKMLGSRGMTTPWVVVADGAGTVVHSGAMPANVAGMLSLLEKYAPKTKMKKAG